MPPHQEALFAPLRRDDLPSFLVMLPDMTVLAATPACAPLGIEAGGPAPLGVKIVAKRVGMSLRRAPRLERVRLPFSLMPKPFACISLHVSIGQVVLFADPLALANSADPARSLPGLTRLPVVTATARPPSSEQRALRFSWAADESGRLTRISPDLPEALGGAADAWIGRDFEELAEAGLLEDGTPMREALLAGSSFFGLTLASGGHPPQKIEFGGVPLFDAARRRLGTRGFGLLWRDGSGPAPVQSSTAEPMEGEAPIDRPFNVVPLRGNTLTAREQSAFHEIARTLTEAIDEWPKPVAAIAAPTSQDAAEMVRPLEIPTPPPAAPAPDRDGEEQLIDRLPIGVVVQQAGTTVRANRTLLGWLGVRDLDEFIASGGLSPRLLRDAGTGLLDLESLHGDRLPVEVRLVSSPWQGRPALVHVIRPLEGGAGDTKPQPPAARDDSAPSEAETGERLQLERATARRQALDFMPFAILLLDRNGTVEIANIAAAEFGFATEEVEGQPFTLLLAPESHVPAVAMLDRALDGEAQQSEQLIVRRRSGKKHAVDALLGPAGESGTRFCLVLREAGEIATPSQPLAGLEDTPERLDTLARRLSHDLRDPLTALLGFVESVQRGTFGPVGNRRYHQLADTAAAAGRAVLQTLGDLDELALPEAPRQSPVLLAPIIEAALVHFADAARRRRVLLRSALPDDVAARCDDMGLARIVRMLVEEALAATPADGQVIVTLAETDEPEPQAALIQIRDGGTGLSEEEIRQILDPAAPAPVSDRFGRLARPFRMARISALVRAQGGTLTLKRGVDVGMLAQIVLPR
ncbi:hypothetical protein GCM10007301_19530 [Azorhizobium oxalatiphilum]|uniref:histidine kinase n=2 Tax=Azorhizobium oxalatiphilum TaxID=980631 RepID=A0A917BV82_9HYPH|nr:hypothetical protein GCM10007301_19530 [Azorhizobium oxalatiphilum]